MCVNIGLIGAPASGKDEVAKFLVEKRGFRRLAFADEIKKSYFTSIGITEEDFKAARGTEREEFWRAGLWEHSREQQLQYGPRVFIEPIIEIISTSNEPNVISDIRTRTELDAAKEAGIKIILVIRDYDEDIISGHFGEEHIKETRGIGLVPLLGCPVLYNNGTLEDLHKKVDLLYRQLTTIGGIE